ncbi:MAG: leucine-rich repeat domain-containing protein [Planctomycetes bacterium]|nr:leucine-rich repeat domain-containing protein [Planctomycetota bacterium]
MTPAELLKLIEQGARDKVTELYLSHAGIEELPPEIGKLTSLTTLSLNGNQLTSLPPEIGQLTSLTHLGLFGNRLTSLPPQIGKLSRLNILYLDGNQLEHLPPEIGKLSCLRRLDLGDGDRTNLLTTLPPELGRLEALTALELDGLKLTDPPAEVVDQGTKAVLAYLREKLEDETPVWESRLLVVGEGGVGKTQILRALNGHDFQIGSETTHGIAIVPLRLPHPSEDGVTMTLNAWDFGGQEVYHATHQFFLASRSLFLLAWNSRLGWEQGKLHYWLDTIKALAPDSPVMLVATHLDERTADLPYDDLKQKYPQIIGEWSLSCLQRNLGDGIDGLRRALQTAAAELPLMGKPTPSSFRNTTRAIRELKKTETWVPASKLWEIMAEHNVSEAARSVLARQLHQLGELIHFHDDEELKDIVLLDAAWVTRNISSVLEHDGIVDGLGIFTHQHMEECWPEIEENLRNRLLRLMERFDLSYRIPNDEKNRSLVVERLSYDPPAYEDRWNAKRDEAGCREIRMKFDPQSTRPAGIPTWFIARTHRFTTRTHWRFGALFKDRAGGHLALIEASPSERFVMLTVRGPNPQNFFAVLRDGLELTLARFPGLQLKRTLPCPHPDRSAAERPCPHEFDLEHLEERMQLDPPRLEIECPSCFRMVSVGDLLFGLHWTTQDAVLGRLEATEPAQTGQILNDFIELRELTQRQFTYQFNRDQRLEESHCPRVFSLRPQQQKRWPKLKDKLFDKKWTLQLYCEEPGCWHPAPGGGEYTIDEPAEWKGTLVPYVGRLVKAFKYSAPLVAARFAFFNPALAVLLADDVELMTELVKKLPEVKADRDLKAEYGLEVGDRARVEAGSLLGSLRELLVELGATPDWGGLKKTRTPEGHWLWLCKEHKSLYQSYESMSQQESKHAN